MNIDLSQIPAHEIIPGYFGKTVHGEHMTVIYWDVKTGSAFPEHNHIQEQVTNIIEGEFELTIDGETKLMKTGDLAVIEPNQRHSGKAITDCKIIDIVSPKRENYNK